MSVVMKRWIAKKAEEMLQKDQGQRLTVTDLAKACGIARQTFYYHFEDIPHLVDYILTQRGEKWKEQIRAGKLSPKDAFKEAFRQMAEVVPRTPEEDRLSGYRAEMQQILEGHARTMLETLDVHGHLFPDAAPEEKEFLLRYHARAMVGILLHLTEQDQEHLDDIAEGVLSQLGQNQG